MLHVPPERIPSVSVPTLGSAKPFPRGCWGRIVTSGDARSIRSMNNDRLLILFAAVNAILYSSLLPLWEGFDEPFHFGYVQHLANGNAVPDARTARLSREISDSLLYAPASQGVKANLPQVVTYSEFFSWPAGRRSQLRQSLRQISRQSRWDPSDVLNYEAHQPPLAYGSLAIPERLAAGIALPSRVLFLRILAALAGSGLLFGGVRALCSCAGLGRTYRDVAVFCVLSSQMTWATLAHITNDWLAVPLAVWTLVLMIRYAASPTIRNVVLASVILSAGLLTKAYFLALEPVLFMICILRGGVRRLALHAAVVGICAVPWYAHNYIQYGTVSGMQESRWGIGPSDVIGAVPTMNWTHVALDSARSALWTANNTFRTFSASTINVVIAACVLALVLWSRAPHVRTEWIIVAYCVTFLVALAYAGAIAHIATRGASSTPSPWYAQVLVPPLLTLGLLGASRTRRFGRPLAGAFALLFGYVLVVTYVFRLIPLYAGYEGRGSVRNIAQLYLTEFTTLRDNLSSATLGSSNAVLLLTVTTVILVIVLETRMIRNLTWANRD